MKRMRKLMIIVIAVVVVIVVLIAAAFAAISLDLSSLGANGSQTLNPAGTSVGKALVVYSPGFSGAAQRDAEKIAGDLQARGYTVVLAGVRSGTTGSNSGYNIVVAGGPMYFGQVSSAIDGYLKTVPSNAKLGVFGSTGSSSFSQIDFQSLQNQVASDTHNEKAVLKLILDGNETSDCADFVTNLVQQG